MDDNFTALLQTFCVCLFQVAGPLIDIVQMFLCALFNVQDEEASQYKTVVENSSGTK